MDITVSDLCELESRIELDAAARQSDQPCQLDALQVSWAVSARTTVPHLPALRGGEVLLLSNRVLGLLGSSTETLLREAQDRQVSAIVVERTEAIPALAKGSIPVLRWQGDISPETETIINRMLTEVRGKLYRIGSELERSLAESTLNRSGVVALLMSIAETTGLPVTVVDAKQRVIATTVGDSLIETDSAHCAAPGIVSRLTHGETFVIGPFSPGQRLIGRFFRDRIVSAIESALLREQESRPRGLRRTEAFGALLAGEARPSSEQRAAALSLGLDPDAVYFVAIGHGSSEAALTRILSGLGDTHLASQENGTRSMLVVTHGRSSGANLADRVAEIKRRWEREHAGDQSTLAISAPAHGVASLPSAAREAVFIATLQEQAGLSRKAATFESIEDVGAMRLLYELRDTVELKHFVNETLGTLQERDQRGTLRTTLRAFLESGGSQVEASQRLGIHRNTLAYRLRRIGELIGQDVADPSTWLTIHLALRAAQVLQVWSDEA